MKDEHQLTAIQISPADANWTTPGKEQQAAGVDIFLQIMMLVLSFVLGHSYPEQWHHHDRERERDRDRECQREHDHRHKPREITSAIRLWSGTSKPLCVSSGPR
ncbi:hypothetical protein FF1_032688 [Malus domestica]